MRKYDSGILEVRPMSYLMYHLILPGNKFAHIQGQQLSKKVIKNVIVSLFCLSMENGEKKTPDKLFLTCCSSTMS